LDRTHDVVPFGEASKDSGPSGSRTGSLSSHPTQGGGGGWHSPPRHPQTGREFAWHGVAHWESRSRGGFSAEWEGMCVRAACSWSVRCCDGWRTGLSGRTARRDVLARKPRASVRLRCSSVEALGDSQCVGLCREVRGSPVSRTRALASRLCLRSSSELVFQGAIGCAGGSAFPGGGGRSDQLLALRSLGPCGRMRKLRCPRGRLGTRERHLWALSKTFPAFATQVGADACTIYDVRH